MPETVHSSHDWLAAVREEIIEPDRPIVDPHHHLWRRSKSRYVLEDLWEDTDSGHKIVKTVFIECRTCYAEDGPVHLRPVGETEFVADLAAQSDKGRPDQARIAGIVAFADLALDTARLDEVLDAHQDAAGGRFRGIRQAGAHEPDNSFLFIKPRQPAGLYHNDDFRRGVRQLGARGLTYDTWHYHHQNWAFLDFARAVPDTPIILDHFGTPLGVGPYAGKQDEIFEQWKEDIAAIAQCDNVYAKLGGLAMPDNGFGWNRRDVPPTSDEFIEAQKRYYDHALACFGVERCMFESNFPVDKWSLSYHVVWNAFKKMTSTMSESEKQALFHDNATRVYNL